MGLSILLGGLSAWAINRHLNDKTEEIESRLRFDQVNIVVAARDLSPDTIIEEADIATEPFPVQWAPDDAVMVENAEMILGKRLHTEIRAGQPLMRIHFIDEEGHSVSARLAPEHRAMTLSIDTVRGASKLIRAGDRVDLFVSFDYQGKRITAVLLQTVEVLATESSGESVGRSEAKHGASEASITISVTQADAVKLVAAKENGVISAVLSAIESSTTTMRSPAQSSSPVVGDLAELLGLKMIQPVRVIPILYGDRLSSEPEDPSESGQ